MIAKRIKFGKEETMARNTNGLGGTKKNGEQNLSRQKAGGQAQRR